MPEDIQRLIDSGVREKRDLEYKRELNLEEDKNKSRQEFLCDVSAMYNSDGGCIIYGIEERRDEKNKNTGYPEKVSGIRIDNLDTLTQRIHDIIRSGTEPSIVNTALKLLDLEEGKVMILGINKGYGLPVMVTYNDINKFYRRNLSGKYAMNVYELNQLFMQNESVMESSEKFRTARIHEVMVKKIYPTLDIKGAVFIHAIPIGNTRVQILDMTKMKDSEIDFYISPIKVNHNYSKTTKRTEYDFNFDGFTTFRIYGAEDKIYAYNQYFRNGAIEFYTNECFIDKEISGNSPGNYLMGFQLIQFVLQTLQNACKIWAHFEVNPPFLVLISILFPESFLAGIRNVHEGLLTKNDIDFPPIYFEKYENTNGEIYDIIKKYFDILWQTAGKKGCPSGEDYFNAQS